MDLKRAFQRPLWDMRVVARLRIVRQPGTEVIVAPEIAVYLNSRPKSPVELATL